MPKSAVVNVMLALFAAVAMCCQPVLAIDSVAEAYAAQAKRCFDRGQIWHATRLYKDAIDHEVKDENDELYVATLRNNLGECYRRLALDEKQRAQYDLGDGPISAEDCSLKAESELKTALEKKEERAGSRTDFLYIAKGLENLAAVYLERSVPKLTDAEALYRKALAIRESKDGIDNVGCASDYLKLGDILLSGDQYSESIANYKKALSIYSKTGTLRDPVLGVCHQKIAIVYNKWNKIAQAGQHYDKAVLVFNANLPTTAKHLEILKERDLPDFPQISLGQADAELREFSAKGNKNPVVYRSLLVNEIAAAKRNGKAGEPHARYLEAVLRQAAALRTR